MLKERDNYMPSDIELMARGLAVVEEQLKQLNNKVDLLLRGENANCIRHDSRIRSIEDQMSLLVEDQRWLRRQWTVAWIGIGSAVILGLITAGLTHMGVVTL